VRGSGGGTEGDGVVDNCVRRGGKDAMAWWRWGRSEVLQGVMLEAVHGHVVGPACCWSRARHGGAWRASLHAAIELVLLRCFCVGACSVTFAGVAWRAKGVALLACMWCVGHGKECICMNTTTKLGL
jgi:hypothetical protein